MKRALTLGLLLIATAVSATELDLATRNTREALGQKTQWAPSGNFWALHGRAVFRSEIRGDSRPYARARGGVASGIGIFLSRDSIGAQSYLSSPNALGPWSYANLSPLRYTDPDGREGFGDLFVGCVDGFIDDTGLAANPYQTFGSLKGKRYGRCDGFGGDTVEPSAFEGMCYAPALPSDADRRRGFEACRASLFQPPKTTLDTQFHDAMHDSEMGVNTRDWWYAGESRQRALGGVFGTVSGVTGMPVPNELPLAAQEEAQTTQRAAAATVLVFTLGEGALAVRNLRPPGPPLATATAGGRISTEGLAATAPSPSPGSLLAMASARNFGDKGTIASGPTAGDRGRYNAYKKEKDGKPFKKFWDWFSSSRGGRSGGPEHQAIQNFISRHFPNPRSKEIQFGDRFADVAGPGEIHQIGGMNARWDPISRERTAVEAILKSPQYANERIFFWDKANPAAMEPTLEYVNGAWEPFLGKWR